MTHAQTQVRQCIVLPGEISFSRKGFVWDQSLPIISDSDKLLMDGGCSVASSVKHLPESGSEEMSVFEDASRIDTFQLKPFSGQITSCLVSDNWLSPHWEPCPSISPPASNENIFSSTCIHIRRHVTPTWSDTLLFSWDLCRPRRLLRSLLAPKTAKGQNHVRVSQQRSST